MTICPLILLVHTRNILFSLSLPQKLLIFLHNINLAQGIGAWVRVSVLSGRLDKIDWGGNVRVLLMDRNRTYIL